jgi:glycosyltransferase involved in cell wall biosynthesis
MKLIIQIPCKDEQDHLPVALADLPREVRGFDTVEWLVIDDGSTDATIEVARAHGVDHIVRLSNNKGLAAAFQAGLDACLKLGADVVVNTDADNQYDAADIPKLVEPILDGRADMVVGDRDVTNVEHFSPLKKLLQRLGSWIVRQASSTNVPDTTSGFRAYNREAAIQMLVISRFTYTLETIIQAGKLLVAVEDVPIRTNGPGRPSRLAPSMGSYVRRNASAIFRVYAQYEPLKVFMGAAAVVGFAAIVVWGRFAYAYVVEGNGKGHVQSLILGAVLFNAAMLLAALGVVGDLLSAQRLMGQRIFERVRRIELELGVGPSHYEPGARDTGVPASTGARSAGATGQTDAGGRGPVDDAGQDPAGAREAGAREAGAEGGERRANEGDERQALEV